MNIIINNGKKWSQPKITSVERMQDAAGGTHTGLSKDGTVTEYVYAGPGS